MNKQYVSVCLNITRETLDVQHNIVSCYNESKGLLPMIQAMSERFENSELIIITRRVDEHSGNFSVTFGSQYPSNVTIKFVGPGRNSKLSQIENLAWQHAIGDIVCYTRTLLSYQQIHVIADRIDRQEVDFFLQDPRNQYRRPLDVSVMYAYHLPIRHKHHDLTYLDGYVISRTTLNHVFYNQDQVYDVFVPLYTSNRMDIRSETSLLSQTKNHSQPNEFYERSEEAGKLDGNQNEEALNQYSPKAMKQYNLQLSIVRGLILSLILTYVGLALSILLTLDGSPATVLITVGTIVIGTCISSIVIYILRRLYTIDLTTRQSAAAAEHKRLTGFATIKVMNKGKGVM